MNEELKTQAITDYSVIDIKTSRISETEDEIIEIGAVKVKDSKIVDTYTTLIKPQKELSNRIQAMTLISNDLLQYAPSIDTVIPKILDFIEDDIIVLYDVKFIEEFLKSNFETLNNQIIDMLPLTRKIFPDLDKNYKLSKVCPKMNINNFKCNSTIDYAYLVMYLYEYYKNNERNQ